MTGNPPAKSGTSLQGRTPPAESVKTGPAALYDKKPLVTQEGCHFCGPDVPRAKNSNLCERCLAQLKGLPHIAGGQS